jgi:hypothetical protein
MRRTEAKAYAQRMNDTGVVRAEIVRILPAHIDPIQENDNGWDVEMTVIDDDFQTIVDQDRRNK